MEEKDCDQPALRFCLFGEFTAYLHGHPIEGLHRRKADRLLTYLILHHSRWVDRSALADLYWDTASFEDPEANLRQSLTYLRPLLGEEVDCIESRTGAIRLILNPVQADTIQFTVACAADDLAALTSARKIAHEPLLSGWKDTWIVPFREQYEKKVSELEAQIATITRQSESGPPDSHTVWRAQGHVESGIKPAGGTMPLDSTYYIEREADRTLAAALARQESIVLIKGARQSGKSSLLARGMHAARQQGRIVCHADCEQFAPEGIASRDAFYLQLTALLAEQCDLTFDPAADWKAHLGANGNLERFLRRRVLANTQAPILWALDGVDRLFKTDYYNEFFALLRGLHTKRATEPDVPWHQLTIFLAAATEAHLYIRDLNQSPFNIGTRITLADFDAAQSVELVHRYSKREWNDTQRQQLQELLGGHPYLLARGLQEMESRSIDVTALADLAVQPAGPFHVHLESIVQFVIADADLQSGLRAVLAGQPCSDNGFFRLRTAGVVSGDAPDSARPRCGLYARYFKNALRG